MIRRETSPVGLRTRRRKTSAVCRSGRQRLRTSRGGRRLCRCDFLGMGVSFLKLDLAEFGGVCTEKTIAAADYELLLYC
jgi:hypothetical protein